MGGGVRKIYPFRVFTVLCLGFLSGILIGSYLEFDFQRSYQVFLLVLFSLLFATLFNYIYKNRTLTIINWTLIFIIFGVVYYSYFDQRSNVGLPYDQELEFKGQIVKKVERDYKKQKVTLKILSSSAAENIEGINILVNAPHYPQYRYGDIVKFNGEIAEPGKIEDFDYSIYLRRYLTFGVVYRPENLLKIGENRSAMTLAKKALYSVSCAFEKSLNSSFSEPEASLASGLILGVKRNMPDDFLEALNITGLTHIIALSGYNVTIIVVALSFLLLPIIGRKKVFWLSLLLVIGFVILTGAASSVVRAAIFSMLIIFARIIGRRGDQVNIMLLAAFVMIIVNPYVLRDDLGFQLSFLAFSGLIFISPILEKIFMQKKIQKIPDIILLPLRETLSAQIAVTPIILIAFGRISLIAPLSNLLILWIIPLAMLLVFIVGLSGIILPWLGKALAYLTWPVLAYIVSIARGLAKIPLSSISSENNLFVIGLVLYIILVFIVIYLKRKYKVVF